MTGMTKIVCLCIVVLMFVGCVGTQDTIFDTTSCNLDAYPLNVFLGVSAPYSTNEKEIAEALYNCARSIAISDGLQVTSKLVSESSSEKGLLSFATDGEALYSEGEVAAILARLELLEVRDNGREGVVVIAADPLKAPIARPYVQQFDMDGRPKWIADPPQIEGYLVAVGETLGYRYLRDSLEAADVTAAQALLEKSMEARTEARSYALDIASEGLGNDISYFQEGVYQINTGSLEGFAVLARWYDRHENRYYSLAIALDPMQER